MIPPRSLSRERGSAGKGGMGPAAFRFGNGFNGMVPLRPSRLALIGASSGRGCATARPGASANGHPQISAITLRFASVLPAM